MFAPYLVGAMMKLTKLVASAVVALSFATGTATAQNLRGNIGPKEFPPETFSGNQYVDSAGCVFIRAGIDGAVSWVPRVTRARAPVCGYTPSLVAEAETPRAVTLASTPVDVMATPMPAQASKPAVAQKVAVSKPASTQPAELLTAQTRSSPDKITPTTRVVPKHVYLNRLNEKGVTIPKGYRSVWKDDRLNPRRAEQTMQGMAQSNMIWTQKTPRRQINPVLENAVVVLEANGVTYYRVKTGASPTLSSRSSQSVSPSGTSQEGR